MAAVQRKPVKLAQGLSLLGLSLLAAIIIASLTGCQSDQNVTRIHPYSPVTLAHPPAPGNPWLIFQTPPDRVAGILPERIGRNPWPLAETPGGYISGPEIISYREYQYSNQYRSGNGNAQDYLNRRIYGVRAVEKIR